MLIGGCLWRVNNGGFLILIVKMIYSKVLFYNIWINVSLVMVKFFKCC